MAKDQREVDRLVERAIRELLEQREPGSSICPSDAARAAYTGEDEGWREWMEPTRRAAWRMAEAGEIDVTQGGSPVTQAEARGPIRLRRAR